MLACCGPCSTSANSFLICMHRSGSISIKQVVPHRMQSLYAQVEVLCSRVGIMVAGRLACLGSSQRLKSLYGGTRIQARCIACVVCRLVLCHSARPTRVAANHSAVTLCERHQTAAC